MQVLKGRRAFVSGSSQGIGKACAMELAKLGASVTLAARNESELRAVHQALPVEAGQSHHYVSLDFSDPRRLQEEIPKLIAEQGAFHILINNTGGPPSGPILGAEPEAFQKAFTQHVVCNQILVQAMVAGMKEARYGRIINIISTSVKQPLPGLGVSNTIRAAVANWSKTMANELGQFAITVNNVLPGYTATGRLEELIEAMARRAGKTADAIRENLMKEVPAGRFASPEEIAAAVGFLASPAASYINGINLPVDGGKISSL